MKNKINFTRINNDTNGNPRFVCHFLNIADDYQQAVKIANTLGGRKFHTKTYGGGIVFQSYNIEALSEKITNISVNK